MTLVQMPQTIVNPPEEGKKRKTFECPSCHGRSLKKLTQGEVILTGTYPAPQVEVRRCKGCGTLSERDKWIEDRLFWRGFP
jgi:NMD protein affecting ribosome stability and mRNA decay